jgi:hypothetical protein
MSTSPSTITNITAASAATAALPAHMDVELPGGTVVRVARLSWLKFEAVWSELAGLLAGLALAPEASEPQQLAQALSGAPAFVLSLCALCTPLGEAELAALPYDHVLALAAAALKLNFIGSAGVRGFFTAVGQLPQALRA